MPRTKKTTKKEQKEEDVKTTKNGKVSKPKKGERELKNEDTIASKLKTIFADTDFTTEESIKLWEKNLERFAWIMKGKYGPIYQAHLTWNDGSITEIWFQGREFLDRIRLRTEHSTECSKKNCIYCGHTE